MNRLRYLLIVESLMRIGSQMGYTALLVFAYNESHRTLELGFVSAGIVLPSLLFVGLSAHINTHRRARLCFLWASAARIIALASAMAVGRNWFALTFVAAMVGLSQQVLQTAKLTIDVWIVPNSQRVAFSSSKATVGSVAVMVGPPLAGVIAGTVGSAAVLAIVALLGAVSIAAMLPVGTRSLPLNETVKHAPGATDYRALLTCMFVKYPSAGLSFVAYVLVVMILEMEAPLLFPFVHEVYGRGADSVGYLLGICGIGSFAGALLMQRIGRPLTPGAITGVLILDGVILAAAMMGIPWPGLFGIFAGLGVISSLTLVSTETQIQNLIPVQLITPVFSLMSFAGGAGGAAMTLVSAAIAEELGARQVLLAFGGLEVIIGASAFGSIWALHSCLRKGQVHG